MMSNLDRIARRDFWENHVAQWRASGLSQVEYCRIHRLSVKSFQYWQRKSRSNDTRPVLVEVPIPRPVPIPVLPPAAQLCLVIDQRYRIEIPKRFDSEDLERVIRVLGRI